MTSKWPKSKLSHIVEVASGQGAPQSPDDFSREGYPLIRAGSLDSLIKGALEDTCEHVSADVAGRYRLRLFPQGTVLFAKSGMSATLGRIYQLKKSAYVVNHLAALIPTELCIPSYLKYWLQANSPSRLIHDASYPSIRLSDISKVKIPLPPLDEQRRITAILDMADAIRKKRQESISLTQEFLRSVFLDMFGDPVTNPKRWNKAPIKELGTVMTGNTPPRKKSEYYGNGIEWIKSDNINTPNHFLTEAKERLTSEGQKVGRIVPKKSILVTCIAGSPECIGNAAIADRAVAFNQQINAVTSFEGVDPYFFYVQILVAKNLIQRQSTESMKGMVSKGKFENILFLKPPYPLQEKFGKIFNKFYATFHKNNEALSESNNLFSAITQRAFQGEL